MSPHAASLPKGVACVVTLFGWALGNAFAQDLIEPLPDIADQFLVDYCLNCHDDIELKGDLSLDFVEIDWSDPQASNVWGKVYEMLEKGEMPPEKKTQPTPAERQEMLSWLDTTLSKHDPPGGTVLRRLNREEYENTIREVLGIPFKAPESFPADMEFHGFDNIGEGLVLSPPLMAQYFAIATTAADLVIPPQKKEEVVPVETSHVGPSDFTLNFTTGHPIDGILRMTSSSDPLARGSVWPNRFQAKVTGRYTTKIRLSPFRPEEGHDPLVKLLAFDASGNSFTRTSTLRELASIRVDDESPKTYHAEVDLQKGETIVVHYDNASLTADKDKGYLERMAENLLQAFREDPKLGAAWKKAGHQRSDRGWSWWHRIQKIKNEPGFSAEGFDPESPEVKAFALKMARTDVNLFETMCCYRFFQGPGLEIHELSISGPMSAERKTVELAATDFTSVGASGTLTKDGRYRLVSSRGTVAESAAWPSRFETTVSGVYDVSFDATNFRDESALYKAGSEPLLIELYARKNTADRYEMIDTQRKLKEFRLPPRLKQPQTFQTEVALEKGETVAIRLGNSPIYLDTSDTALSEKPNLEERVSHKQFAQVSRQELIRNGPALDLLGMKIVGPVRLVEDDELKERRLRTERFMGHREGRSDEDYARAILQPFLDKAFRRPATNGQAAKYVDIALRHAAEGHRFEDGIHLAIRAALCSPRFLYRGMEDGPLDDYDLASRLSYFLTSSPPDGNLLKQVSNGSLSNTDTLAAETRRLLASKGASNFLDSFAGQWLDLRLLPDIMPDTRLLNWNDNYLDAITAETKLFIAEILRENHPLETFIDPDFTYLNRHNAKLYDHPYKGGNSMERVRLERGGRHGGILGQASVMMATANGVDTQPVLRGVWLLENVLGDPPSEPPPNVPAVEPDTSGASSIRELLERHQEDESCASCHRKIDPPGFALENFDPIGRWRTFYPVYEKKGDKVVTVQGQTVDATGRLPDGTELNDVTDLKRYLVNHIDVFSRCLTEKLLVYATGREPGYGDRKEIHRIVNRTKEQGNGFQDLIVELVLSESFRTK